MKIGAFDDFTVRREQYMKKGIISLGEALIDFIPMDKANLLYQKSPGGAPANVAVGLAALGVEVTFLGKVGKDVLGTFLHRTLASYGVDVSRVSFSEEVQTGVVFVELDAHGERTFSFFNQPSADSFLEGEEVDEELFKSKKILHIGSISLIHESVRKATWRAIKLAKKNNMLLSYDPNLRISLWENERVAKQTITSVLPYVDVLKLSEEELAFLMGGSGEQELVTLARHYNIPLVFVTRGAHGSISYCLEGIVHVPAIKVETIDTTGAGDAFVSAMLYQVHEQKKCISNWSVEEVKRTAAFAAVSGGLATASKGAMNALPTLEAIQKYLK